jgi:hypothetical protein
MLTRAIVITAILTIAVPHLVIAETNLGIKLKQGGDGRPIVVEVINTIGNGRTLGSYLQLQSGDVIVIAHSDPISLPDGAYHEDWEIHSIRELIWVLKRTTSRIGLTVKRGDSYVKSIATYTVSQRTATGPDGRPYTVQVGVWVLHGPLRVDSP